MRGFVQNIVDLTGLSMVLIAAGCLVVDDATTSDTPAPSDMGLVEPGSDSGARSDHDGEVEDGLADAGGDLDANTRPVDAGSDAAIDSIDDASVDAAIADAGTLAHDAGAPATDAGISPPGPRPTGHLSLTETPCMGGRADICYDMAIECPGIEDLGGSVAVYEAATSAVGTVILHKGGGGTSFLDLGFVEALESAGYRVVQLRYDTDWEQDSHLGMVAAGCRPATVFREVARRHSTTPTCLVGFSGGSGAIGFAMAHYGLENDVRYALLAAGPPFGRIDYGCAPDLYSGEPRNLCPALTDAPYAYGRGPRLDGWMGTTGCGGDAPSAADVAMWQASSIVSAGADYDYGSVRMDWFFCASNPNETTGLGDFYIDRITSPKSVACYTDSCTGEQVFNNASAFAAAVSAITAHCQ